jgi:putative ABC transport system ATP-binding protein
MENETNSNTIIEVIDLQKIYGMGDIQVAALDGISLKIRAGEFVAVMGPSGSGKSTLMNILGCLDRPTAGQYILGGEDVSHLSKPELAYIRNHNLGFIFQSYNLLPRMSAFENVVLPMMYRRDQRLSAQERYELAMHAIEQVGLTNRAQHLPKELSGGQQQRVAIARALVNNPLLVLADEPTGNLDTKSSWEILDLLHRLNDEGRTIVMVTHEPDIAEHTNHILHIRDGKLESDQANGYHAIEAKARLRNYLQAAAEGEKS